MVDTSNKIQCEICELWYKQITSTHLKQHEITLLEYKFLYPNSPIVSPEVSQKLISANKEKWSNPEYKEKVSNTISKVIINQWENGKYNRIQSKDHKRKRAKSQSETKQSNPEKYSGISAGHYGIKHSDNSKNQMSINSSGNKNGMWKGGISGIRDHLLLESQCLKLNEKFEGFDGHHITSSIIIYIPKFIHRSISHNMKNGKNMNEINEIALEYLRGDY